MSFAKEVKEELSRQVNTARHCKIAEIAAIISLCGHIYISEEDKYSLQIRTEIISVARKCFTLLKKTFNIDTDISVRQGAYLKKGKTYIIHIRSHEDTIRLLETVKLLHGDGEIKEDLSLENTVVKKDCCKRAFVRGAFLAAGSMNDPTSSYHFEIVCPTMDKAKQLQDILRHFELEAKIVERKRHFVVYLKESEQIVDVLNIMEAHVALMKLENIRILKDMRNTVNRQVNCETANLNKIAKTASKQIADIQYIDSEQGLSTLNEGLEAVARLRLSYPEASLAELGTMLNPPVGKSGVNHRLRKLGDIAEDIRSRQGGKI
jgi:hypothetical protein